MVRIPRRPKVSSTGPDGIHAAFRWGQRNQQAMGEVVIGPPNYAHQWVSSHDDPGANVLSEVEKAASQPDNRKKLRGHSATVRHIFVWVTDTNYLPWRDLSAGALPNRAPTLPQEITSVWVAAALPGGDTVWRWGADGGWTSRFI
jgi:hypothetical protein